jgi:hypothetical protein
MKIRVMKERRKRVMWIKGEKSDEEKGRKERWRKECEETVIDGGSNLALSRDIAFCLRD